jgi:hypothetical protein
MPSPDEFPKPRNPLDFSAGWNDPQVRQISETHQQLPIEISVP